MSPHPKTLAIVGATFALAAGCASGSESPRASAPSHQATTSTNAAAPTTAAAATARVTIKNFAFGTPITVRPGTVVTVTNADNTAHTVTADGGSFDTKPIFGGRSARFTAPSAPGSYAFHCNIHGNMHGKLVVKD